MTEAADRTGRLVLVVGPSGAGKDSLIEAARQALRGQPGYVFPHRIITRRSDPGSEEHVTLSEADFTRRQAAGDFFLHWPAHGLHYALPASIAADLAASATVVANVSRSVVDEARRRHPATSVIFVTAPAAVLEQRLLARGREDLAAVRARLARSSAAPAGPGVATVINDGPLAVAAAQFLAVLKAQAEA